MSELERGTEEDEGGSTSDTAPMLPRRPPDHQTSGLATQGLRTLLLLGQALTWLLLHLLLPGMVFLLVLLPAVVVVYLGFLCHSRPFSGPAQGPSCLRPTRLGLLPLTILVLASTARDRLIRRLRPLLSPLAWTPWLPGPNGEEQLCAWVTPERTPNSPTIP
ncbi:Transmembrane protein 88B [Fukomys damarensis]|uniref:Transmembrane protein 88B n=1 Tax=Fukomys damarensis TaxID=885580 RepID=A0A091DL18_FUKDA|nr:Transmembrane protein 88B [Fukomys damarensis]